MSSPTTRFGVLIIIALMLTPADGDSGTVLWDMSLKELTDAAGVAFAGTVDSVRTDVVNEVRAVRSVYFSRLEFAKGVRRDRLVLKLAGSNAIGPLAPPDNAIDLRREWDCTFEAGRRYIVLCDSSLGFARVRNGPIAGIFQGYFPVGSDTKTGVSVVLDRHYRPITDIALGVAVPLIDPDPGTRVTEGMFLDAIRTFTVK